MESPDHSRRQDRRSFVLRYGVLGWGLCTAVLFSAAMASRPGAAGFWAQLPVALALFPLGGWVWGEIMWRRIRARDMPG